jgi:psiF repeat
MIRHCRLATLLPALALTFLTCGSLGIGSIAAADEPPAATPPANDGAGRHHNPAWAACKKQADDQKLEPGDARRDFMKNCMKSAHASAPAAS